MKKTKIYIIDAILLVVLIFFDQLTKYLAVINLKNQPAFPIINEVLVLNYLENKGAAFGMLQNQKIFFVLVACVFLSVMVFVIIRMPAESKFNKMHLLLTAISAGAIGNMIDRIRLDYVVDFIYFSIINFPIFNFADVCVTVSTVLVIIFVLFVYKDKDFSFLSLKPEKYKEIK